MNFGDLSVGISHRSLRGATSAYDAARRSAPNRPSAISKLCMIWLMRCDSIGKSSNHLRLCHSNCVLLCHARLGGRTRATNRQQDHQCNGVEIFSGAHTVSRKCFVAILRPIRFGFVILNLCPCWRRVEDVSLTRPIPTQGGATGLACGMPSSWRGDC